MACEVEDTEVWRAVHEMIQLYGDDAVIHAAMRADGLLELGDTEGFFLWKRIARAISTLKEQDACSKLPN